MKWDIGNWRFPGGLFPSDSSEQTEFDRSWAEATEAIGQTSQPQLEQICRDVLIELRATKGSPLKAMEGLIVMGPDDSAKMACEKLVPGGAEKGSGVD